MKFLIAIECGNDDQAYGVIVPDLPGCFSAGDTFEEAFANAHEAIDLHVQTMLEDGAVVPAPKGMDVHAKDPELAGMTFAMVDVDVERYMGPAEKINITVPALLLNRIDRFAQHRGESRSGFLVRAAMHEMELAG